MALPVIIAQESVADRLVELLTQYARTQNWPRL